MKPLPNKAADRLLFHLKVCDRCRGDRAKDLPIGCPTGRRLIKATMKERHG